jgi:hypothetical protein
MKKSALFTVIMGLLTLVTFALLMIEIGGEVRPWQYPNPHGFKAAMVWFELTDTADELFANLGPADSGQGKEIRAKMDAGNKYDFLFMPCYSIFFASVFLYMNRALKSKGRSSSFDGNVLRGMCLCALLMLIGDVLENRQLFLLTTYNSVQEVPSPVLCSLKLWTTMKWGSIFFACAVASVYYARYFSLRRPVGILFVLLYACSAWSGALGLIISHYRFIIETTNTIIAIAWFSSIIHAGILAFSRSPENT